MRFSINRSYLVLHLDTLLTGTLFIRVIRGLETHMHNSKIAIGNSYRYSLNSRAWKLIIGVGLIDWKACRLRTVAI